MTFTKANLIFLTLAHPIETDLDHFKLYGNYDAPTTDESIVEECIYVLSESFSDQDWRQISQLYLCIIKEL